MPPVVPVIDVAALVGPAAGERDQAAVARQIGAACREHGFFYVSRHGVDTALCHRLETLSRRFFDLPEPQKMRWRMALGGRAWRGYFPLGDELTSNRPDWKEGLYLGTELPPDHPRVRERVPLHGANLFPDDDAVPGLRETVLAYMHAVTQLGHALMRGIALSLDLPADWFAARYTGDPLILFRLFNYPSRPVPEGSTAQWGVGEHTDYGLLTILWQDDVGGLQVKVPRRAGASETRSDDGSGTEWIAAPPVPGTFVCNIGDMLDRMTGGLYRSTPHRVAINTSGRDRLSFPLFFDPDFDARVQPVPGLRGTAAAAARWDGADLQAFEGTYGDYLLAKVSKVFPQLRREVL